MKRFVSCLLITVITAMICLATPTVSAQEAHNGGLRAKPAQQIKYVASQGLVSGVSPNTAADAVLAAFETDSADVYICDSSGERLYNETVGTGCTVNYKSSKKTESAQIVIYGDVNGDGSIAAADMLQIKRYILGVQTMSEISQNAANVSSDNEFINSADLLAVKRDVLGLREVRNSSYYYVSKDGSDSGDGSETSPYLTIQKAASVMQAGDTCLIGSGIYRETVTPANEGEDGAPITFSAAQGADVTVSGTDAANTNWTLYKDGIFKTDLTLYRGSENQIFVDGEMAQIARYPNKNDDNFIAVGDTLSASSASDSFAQNSALSSTGLDFSGAEIAIEGTNHYLYYTSTVTSQSGESVQFDRLDSGWDSPTGGSNFYFFNKLGLLDAENEYYYENGTLYYKPVAGVDLNNSNVEYSARSMAFDTSDRSYISISGITIYGANVRTNEGSDHLNLSDNKILYFYHTTKARSYPWAAWFFGVELYGDDSVVQNCEIAYGAEGGVEVHGDRCSVVNNYIHDINYVNSNAAAVENFNCDYTLVSHNTIRNVARSAIILGCANMRVCYNDISECAVNTHDVSGIGSYKNDAMGTVEVDHNIVRDTNNDHMFTAYYLDNGSFNYTVHHNVSYNVDGAMTLNNPSYGNRIYNNTFIGDKPIGTGNLDNPYDNNSFIGAVWHGDQFYNNILPSVFYGEGVMCSNNLLNRDTALNFTNASKHDYTLQDGSSAIDSGLVLPIGCEQYSGDAPDIGAFEYGEDAWQAGCDFTKTFDTEYSLSEKHTVFSAVYGKMFIEPEFGENLLANSDFSDGTTGWGAIGTTVADGKACIKEGWIEQSISVQPGQIYKFSGNVKGYDITSSFIEFGVHFMDGDNIINQGAFMVTSDADGERSTLISVPEGCNKIRFFVATWASGQTCYADDLGLYLAK